MNVEKAYKLLARQENISNNKAKELIDLGLVFINGKKVKIARKELSVKTHFKIEKVDDVKIIYEDGDIVAINKPAMVDSNMVVDPDSEVKLINRLDRETSGVLLLSVNEEFRTKAIAEYANKNVYKEYVAIVSGIVAEPMTIDAPIETKKGTKARSKVSYLGKEAVTLVEPMMTNRKYSLVKIIIKTGRTHQIRVHLSHVNHPLLGDEFYGGSPYKRVMLHSYICKIFDYEFKAPIPNIFNSLFQS